jgi:hypothetical protein
VAQGVGPEFKSPILQNKQTNKQKKKKTLEPECLITSPGEADARNT